MNDPKRLSGALMATAGALFLVAAAIQRLRQPVWLALGVALARRGDTP
ncbi:MAG: hypothetical protein ACXWZ4_02770 [Gemmatirosa sp.]